jgi:hypothetical protein
MAGAINTGATVSLVLAFGCLMAAAAVHLDPEHAANLTHISWGAVPAAIPAVTQAGLVLFYLHRYSIQAHQTDRGALPLVLSESSGRQVSASNRRGCHRNA